MSKISGIIIKTAYDVVGDTSKVELFSKTCLEWVSLAIKTPVSYVQNDESVSVPNLIRPYLDTQSDYTVVLYSDTPLITAKTVCSALKEAENTGANVIKMTRGFIFKTSFISAVDNIYSVETKYFDEEDFIVARSFKQIALIGEIMRNRILSYHMERGVFIEDMASTYIGSDVSIGTGVRISPNNTIKGNTVIKNNVRIDVGNHITDSILDEGAYVISSKIMHSYVGKNTEVGPYAHVRADNVIGDNCKVGDFVELKKCRIGNGCKMGHLAYLGNVAMGKECNVGAGVVFANYDGKNKFTTAVGDRVFIGSQSTIVAPCKIDDSAFIGAGSVITHDVTSGALALGRARQIEKRDWKGNKFAPLSKEESEEKNIDN